MARLAMPRPRLLLATFVVALLVALVLALRGVFAPGDAARRGQGVAALPDGARTLQLDRDADSATGPDDIDDEAIGPVGPDETARAKPRSNVHDELPAIESFTRSPLSRPAPPAGHRTRGPRIVRYAGVVLGADDGFVALASYSSVRGVSSRTLLERPPTMSDREMVIAVAPVLTDGSFAIEIPEALARGRFSLNAITPRGAVVHAAHAPSDTFRLDVQSSGEVLEVAVHHALGDAPIDVFWQWSLWRDSGLARAMRIQSDLRSLDPYLRFATEAILWRAARVAANDRLRVPAPGYGENQLSTSRAGAVVTTIDGVPTIVPAPSDDGAAAPTRFIVGFLPNFDALRNIGNECRMYPRPRGRHLSATIIAGVATFEPIRPGDLSMMQEAELRHDGKSWISLMPGESERVRDGTKFDHWRRAGNDHFAFRRFVGGDPAESCWFPPPPVPPDEPVDLLEFEVLGGEESWHDLGPLPYSCIAPDGGSTELWTLGMRSELAAVIDLEGNRATWTRWALAVEGPHRDESKAGQAGRSRQELLPELRIVPRQR